MIRGHALQMEKSGVIAQQVLAYIYDQKLFKMYMPLSLGGTMTPLPEALMIIEQASWINGSFGWSVMIGAGGGFFTSFIPDSLNLDLFTDPKAVIAGSGHPSGIAVQVDGGYNVTGQWKFCSGSQYATLVTANCILEHTADQLNPETRVFIFTPKQVRIIEDWHAFGLKATGSHSIAVNSVFVPNEMTFSFLDQQDLSSNPVFQYPFLQFAEATICAVSIGLCKHFIEEAKLLSANQKDTWNASKENRYTYVRGLIDSAEKSFLISTKAYYELMDVSWQKLMEQIPITEAELKQISQQCKETARAALTCGQLVFPYLGIQAIMENKPINQIWRDLQTVSQHSLLIPITNYP
jgi:hypothetical protein